MTTYTRVAVLLLAGAAALAPSGAPAADPETVARVNGEPVSSVELERMRGNPRTLGQARVELGVEDPDPEALRRIALRNVIHRRLLVQEARRRDVEVTDRELDDAVVSLRRRFDDLRSFGEWMKQQDLDEGALFETVRADLAADRVRAALVEGVRVTDEQVLRYHEEHRDELRREEVRLRIIVVRDEATANEIVAALRRGEDFGRIARKRSMGARAAHGGDMGWLESTTLRPPLREAVASMGENHVRGPIPRGSEFLIVLLQGRRPGAALTLAQARSEIERRLQLATRQDALQAWLTDQERKSTIEVFAARPAGLHDGND